MAVETIDHEFRELEAHFHKLETATGKILEDCGRYRDAIKGIMQHQCLLVTAIREVAQTKDLAPSQTLQYASEYVDRIHRATDDIQTQLVPKQASDGCRMSWWIAKLSWS